MKTVRRASRRWVSAWLAAIAALATILGLASPTSAHSTPGSVATVDFTVDGARIEQDVPIEELERALHRTLTLRGDAPIETVGQNADLLRAYAKEHVRATSHGGGAPWRVEVLDVVGHPSSDGPRALFHFALSAPPGDASSSVDLRDDLVAHEVVSHYTTVLVRSDWATGSARGEARLVGTIHAGHFDVVVARSGSFWRGFTSVVSLGIEHIATGTDHLMFLLALVLVAPVAAARGRWRTARPIRETLVGLGRVVSAFTIGHSVTLALGAFGLASVPSVFVEAAIAASILVTAAHAVRPLFPRREALVAGLFGLVHGLAFASTLDGRNLGHVQTAWTLLGFNTGIEIGQLAILATVVPWLILLSQTRFYPRVRAFGGGVAGVLAAGWLLERTTSLRNPLAAPVAWLEAHPVELLVALASAALAARYLASPPARRLESA